MNPRYLLFVAVFLLLSSCSVFTPAIRTGTLDMRIESLENGHLMHIRVDRPVGSVTALVTTGQWLVVTIADSLLDAKKIESSRSSLVDTVEITNFSTVLQLAFHLTVGVDAVEVIHDDPSQDILISLFTPRKRTLKK